MANVTVKDLISKSLRTINALGVGDVLDADTAQNCLDALNDMMDGLNIEPLMIYTINSSTFNLTGGKRDYLMGPTAVSPDFTATRPVVIQAAGVVVSGVEYALDIIGDDEWEALALKSLITSIPRVLYNHGDWPNTTLSVWPAPSSPYQIIIYSQQNLSGFTDVNAVVSLPPGYNEFLRYNLAVRMAIELQLPVSPALAEMAVTTKAKIKRSNASAPLLSCDAAIMGGPRWGSLSDFLGGR